VDHCEFVGSKSMSLGLRITSQETLGRRNRFDHNVFRDIIRYSDNGQEAIQLGQGGPTDQLDAETVVEYNTFDNASGDAEFISNKSSRNLLRYNVAANCRGALVLRGGNHCRVEGNVLVRNTEGIRVHGGHHAVVNNLLLEIRGQGIILGNGGPAYAPVEGCLIAHNTVVNPRLAGIATRSVHPDSTVAPRGNRLVNNLVAAVQGTLLAIGNAPDNAVVNNLLWASGQAQVGVEGRGALLADPRLLVQEGGIRLAPGSPAIDRALPLEEVPRDRLGRLRGAAPDIGAEEVGAGAATIEALPEVPPGRLPLDGETLKGALRFVLSPDGSAGGMDAAPREALVTEGDGVRLTDGAVWLKGELPADFVAEWEYSPAALTSRAWVLFAAPQRQLGYALGFGGEVRNLPDGVVTLAKGAPENVVADGPDTVLSNRGARRPGPDVWYRCRLVKYRAMMRLELAGTPVLVWEDTGLVDGSRLGAGALGLRQLGTGRWRGLRVWECRP
ncbi:MAG: chondroitinase-B domain-containing protein, partial [Armatimonadota bacterium]|nr:chondroitinase-B domain-containing protein [Armatimonadota bacterium]